MGANIRQALTAGLVTVTSMMAASGIYDFKLNSIDGQPISLSAYRGKALLLVNVASQCGYTPQYAGLEALYRKYKDRGLIVAGVPANDFGSQEPGTNEEIKAFCSRKFHVTFPMFAKVSVRGANETELYKFLTSGAANAALAGDIAWNFTKFLVDRNGRVVARFEPDITPESHEMTDAVEAALR